jgi:Solute carrier family 35
MFPSTWSRPSYRPRQSFFHVGRQGLFRTMGLDRLTVHFPPNRNRRSLEENCPAFFFFFSLLLRPSSPRNLLVVTPGAMSEPNVQSQALSPYLTDDKKAETEESISSRLPSDQIVARPEIDYSSVGAFFRSTWRRFVSLWTRRFVLSLLAGQVVSLCITCTNVTTEELTNGNWQLPTTQTFFLYLLFFSSLEYGLSF